MFLNCILCKINYIEICRRLPMLFENIYVLVKHLKHLNIDNHGLEPFGWHTGTENYSLYNNYVSTYVIILYLCQKCPYYIFI